MNPLAIVSFLVLLKLRVLLNLVVGEVPKVVLLLLGEVDIVRRVVFGCFAVEFLVDEDRRHRLLPVRSDVGVADDSLL